MPKAMRFARRRGLETTAGHLPIDTPMVSAFETYRLANQRVCLPALELGGIVIAPSKSEGGHVVNISRKTAANESASGTG